MYATKIQMKPGCRTSNNLQEIDSIYIEGYPFYRFAKKSEVYDYLNQNPRTIQVAIAPYPYVIPALSAYGEKYVRSEANGTSRDNLLMGKNQHVTPHPDGGWQVKGAGNSRATVRTETQKEAIDIARDIARNQESELFIHGENGRIRERDSHGHDPYPPKG